MKSIILALALVGLVFGHPHSCSIQTEKAFYDLTKLQQLDFSMTDDTAEMTTTYFNLCGPVASIPECSAKNVAVCVQTAPNTYVSKGYESMKSLSTDEKGALVLSYSGDVCDGTTQFTTDLTMVCDTAAELMQVESVNDADKCHRVITVSSPAFCPTTPHRRSKIMFPFIAITALAACCCACLCCACKRRFRRSQCQQQGQQQSACQKKCFFQRFCGRKQGYQPVSTQTELSNAIPMQEQFTSENAYPPAFMYPPMYPMFNGQQTPFVPIPMTAKAFQEHSDEAYARQLQEQINHETA